MMHQTSVIIAEMWLSPTELMFGLGAGTCA